MADPLAQVDLADPDAVVAVFARGAEALRDADCRQKSIDRIEHPGRLIATGDLHDNPFHLAKLVTIAGLGAGRAEPAAHLLLHEIIHSDRLVGGLDFSYRALARVAALKARWPEHVHVVLANHELAQVTGAGIVKDGVRVVEAFNAGIERLFRDEATRVDAAIKDFIRAMPLALRCHGPRADILCAHSLPSPWMMSRFDPGVLSRELTDADYEPRQGAAHLMVWGREYDADQIEDLVERWGVQMFILGHQKVDAGAALVPPCAIVLNSDHDRGVYLPLDLERIPEPQDALGMVVPLAD